MTIFDIGAYDGEPYLQNAKNDPNLLVYAFEPNRNQFNKILNSAKSLPNYNIYLMAVSEIDGSISFYENSRSCSNSIMELDTKFTPLLKKGKKKELKTLNKVSVISTRLDTFIIEKGITEIDFLKIDAEGADLQVVKSCGDLLNIVKQIKLEILDVPIYKDGNTYSDTVEYLSKNGFEVSNVLQKRDYKDVIFKNKFS